MKLWSAERAQEVLTSFLPDVDLLSTGKEEAALLTGEEEEQAMIRALQGYGIETIAIKKGADGSLGVDRNEQLEMPPADPGKVVDTVGAGDGFNAGFILGILKGWPLKETLTFANTVGAMVISVMGDNEGLPIMEEVQARLGKREVIQR